MIYVLYHNDKDGQGAAYCAWKKFGDKATYIPVQHGEERPYLEPGSEVYIVDFSYPRKTLEHICEHMKKVVLLDHHKTAQADLEGFEHPNADITFNMGMSGAMMSWFHFIGNETGAFPPKIIEHIQDRDMWLFKMNGTAEVHEFLCSFPYSHTMWDYFINHMPIEMIYREGLVICRAKDRIVSNLVKNANVRRFADFDCPVVNTPVYGSEVGNELLNQLSEHAFAMVWSVRNGKYHYSLMSRQGEDFDVSILAKQYGGGGHKNAAGFITEAPV